MRFPFPVLLCGLLACGAAQATEVDETVFHRLKNAGFERLGEDRCVDVFNGGEFDNETDMRPCADYSGQLWRFTGMPTALRHLDTYTMTTAFRGADMCLTVDGTLIDHVLRLAPCADPPAPNQLWSLAPGSNPDGREGVTIEPMPSAAGEDGWPMVLGIDTPPHGDGRPQVNGTESLGDGAVWQLVPTDRRVP